jgi:hypothetical protein
MTIAVAYRLVSNFIAASLVTFLMPPSLRSPSVAVFRRARRQEDLGRSDSRRLTKAARKFRLSLLSL